MATRSDFTFERGEDVTLTYTLLQADGVTRQNITGWTMTFRAGTAQYGAATITKTPTITDATNGVFTVQLASADTSGLTQDGIVGTYYYDVRRTDSGSRTELFEGILTVQDTFTNG